MKKQLLENKIRRMVKNILKEDNTVPKNASFTVIESFKQLKRMMAFLENAASDKSIDVDSFWKAYDNIMKAIRNKLDQIDTIVNRSR